MADPQDLTYTVAAQSRLTIAADRTGLAVLESNLASFTLQFDDGAEHVARQGFEFRPDGGYRKVTIINDNAVALTATLMLFNGSFIDRRLLSNRPQGLSPATVQDIADQAFIASATVDPASGEYGWMQLWNPANSGRLAIVHKLILSTDTAMNIRVGLHGSQVTAQGPFAARSKYGGKSDSALEVYKDEAVIDLADTVPDRNLFSLQIGASSPQPIDYTYAPLVIPPGWSCVIGGTDADVRHKAVWELVEVDGA
jgi:hypothetical protein